MRACLVFMAMVACLPLTLSFSYAPPFVGTAQNGRLVGTSTKAQPTLLRDILWSSARFSRTKLQAAKHKSSLRLRMGSSGNNNDPAKPEDLSSLVVSKNKANDELTAGISQIQKGFDSIRSGICPRVPLGTFTTVCRSLGDRAWNFP
jgi:hypothetical protein